MTFLPLSELPILFPYVVAWIKGLEKQAKESGDVLTPIQQKLARHVGVTRPDEIRILTVPQIPLPTHRRVKELAQRVGLLTLHTGGLTAGHGVILRLNCSNDPGLWAHEFAHVEQYERFGMEHFLRQYILQISEHGYLGAPLEIEADAKALKACRDAGFKRSP